jgi:amino acid adenylation domain-containing protein
MHQGTRPYRGKRDTFQLNLQLLTDEKYAIALRIEASESNILLNVAYWGDEYSEIQAQSISCTLEQAISSLMNSPKSSVTSLDIMGQKNIAQLREWNSETPQRVDRCVHHVIQEWVKKQPDQPAICTTNVKLDYETLDNLAGRLAHHLVGLGAGPGVIVPFCFDKSAWTIVAMLATVKSGAAITFIDPKYPVDRMTHIIEGVDAKIILCAPEYAGLFEKLAVNIVPVEPGMLFSFPPVVYNSNTVSPSDLIAIVFTSGSTGKPKGIMLEHHALVNDTIHTSVNSEIKQGTRHLQFAAYSFDPYLNDIFSCLMLGATICCPTEHERMDDLTGFINRMNCTSATITPTVASTLHPSTVPSIKSLTLAGEALGQKQLDTWVNSVKLINTYGPAECTVSSTSNPWVTPETSPANIGTGKYTGSRTWITQINQPYLLAPIGAVGELLIEGPKVARGYLDGAQTAKAFFNAVTWAGFEDTLRHRVYKTGDLVRYNSDGTINFCGRKDTQVKLRGQRVELGEIEHHIRLGFPSAVDVAVEMVKLAKRNESINLVAFFTDMSASKDGIAPNSSALRLSESSREALQGAQAYLTGALPSYMIPSMFVPLQSMPVNMSGKTDRLKLRSIAANLSDDDIRHYALQISDNKTPPRTAAERALRDLWAEVLGVESELIGVDDSFFRLGGDSVGAMRLASAALRKGLSLHVADIFRNPVLSQMAEGLDNVAIEETFDKDPEPFSLLSEDVSVDALLQNINSQYGIRREAVKDIYPCTPAQEKFLEISVEQPGAWGVQYTFMLPETIDPTRFVAAVDEMVESLDILRTRIVRSSNQKALQVVLSKDSNWVDASAITSLDDYIAMDSSSSAEFGKPLTKYALVKDSHEDQTYFVWTIHHALYDGWSTPMMFDQLARAYDQKPLQDTPPFSRYIKYLSDSSDSDASKYWSQKLAGSTSTHFPELPSPEYKAKSVSGFMHKFQMDYSKTSGITSSTFIHAAWAIVLGEHSGQEEVIFGDTVTGRGAPVSDITSIVGPTLSTIPVRIHLDPEQSVMEYLNGISQQTTDGMAHEHFGLQNIQKLSSDCQTAAHFTNLIVVQPKGSSSRNKPLGLEAIPQVNTTFRPAQPLTLEFRLGADDLEMEFWYDPDLIPSIQITEMALQFEVVLHQLGRLTSGQKLSDIGIISSPLFTSSMERSPSSVSMDTPSEDLGSSFNLDDSYSSCSDKASLDYSESSIEVIYPCLSSRTERL